MVASVLGKVIVVASVPANVIELLTVTVFPSAIVKVDPVAGAVRVTLFIEVAVATPNVGVTKVGDVSITNLVPVPVCEAIEVAFPTLVIGPVKLAFVAFAVVTKAVVARAVLLSPAVCVTPIVPVGNVGVPVKVGEIVLTTSPVPDVAISSTTPALPVKLPNTLPAATF